MGENRDKGNELETAVEFIETAILRNCPDLSEGSFKIERNKIITVSGVRHEIDLMVTVTLDTRYVCYFIFECKNWSRPCSKNEVIIFAEKVRAVGAQRGFLVSTGFTGDAIAQSQTSERVECIITDSSFPVHSVIAECQFRYLYSHIDLNKCKPYVECFPIPHGSLPTNAFQINSEKYIFEPDSVRLAKWNNLEMPLNAMLAKIIQDMVDNNMKNENTSDMADAFYVYSRHLTREFARGDFTFSDFDVAFLAVDCCWHVILYRPAILSRYDVKTRGRVYNYEPIPTTDLAVSFVEASPQADQKEDGQTGKDGVALNFFVRIGGQNFQVA